MKNIRRLFRNPLSILFPIVLMALAVALVQCKKDQWPVNGNPEEFTYYTEDYPPFNYQDDGQLNGISVDLLDDIFKGLGLSITRTVIKSAEWTSAYDTTLSTPNTMLFSMVRTTEREDLFKWVGPIAQHTEEVVALKGSGVELNNITDLNNYFTGVVAGYSSIDLLMAQGVLRANIVLYDNLTDLYNALINSHEIQCISTSAAAHDLIIQARGMSATDFTIPLPVHSDELFYAFNKETSDVMIQDFQDQFDKIKNDKGADGYSEYEKILSRYNLIQHGEDGLTDEMVVNLVDQTVLDMQADAPGTISKINQELAPYLDATNPDLYTFVYDTDVVIVAHAQNPLLVGSSLAGKPDVTGKMFRDEIVQGALKNGSGWVDYIYTRPDQGGLFYKTTYYQLVTGSDSNEYVVCAGKYK